MLIKSPFSTEQFPRITVSKVEKITVQGKFFFCGKQKFFVKGVSYGPFCVGSHGTSFPERLVVEKDFALMAEMGVNCIRIYTVPPNWLLDIAANYGLRMLISIPWTQHVFFLDSDAIKANIREAIATGVRSCQGHPAVFAYLIGNEIPPDVIRWHGSKQVSAFLQELVAVVKEIDPKALVSYANFPSTEYLELDFIDFLSFNVYLHREEDFRRYVSRLHNLAGDRPLVLTEFGVDSISEGIKTQANILDWQVRTSFEMGAAGTVIFSWTDEWFTGGFDVQDWAFGLVDRERREKPAYYAVQEHYKAPLPPVLSKYPKVSVVVCAYNADRTMNECLASLEKLNYPNYEVIVINDGSRDRTLEIAQSYDYINLISQENKGLSVARNVGMVAATGEIIAYTDSDCVADPDWLTYLVAKFLASDVPAVGGPNFPPPEDSLIPSCVAVSPGGPTHVLLSDEIAEHIAGCNMAFRREVLEEIGGFDPLYRAAGDDIDICWRLQDKGYKIGYSPAAVVWHYRRNTVSEYLKQQEGYGKAEALVYFKHPDRFNLLGQASWQGRIYGGLSSFLFSRQVIYSGTFGQGLFQSRHQLPSSLFAYLPMTLEWNLLAVISAVLAPVFGGYMWLGIIPLLVSWGYCLVGAWQADIDPRFQGMRSRLLVALLIYLGPLVRGIQRYRWRIQGFTQGENIDLEPLVQKPQISWHEQSIFLSYWTDAGVEKESLLQGLINFLVPHKYFLIPDGGWNNWDLEIYKGLWSKLQLKVCTENHGGNKRQIKVRCALKMTQFAILALCAYCLIAGIAALLEMPKLVTATAVIGGIHAAVILYLNIRLGIFLSRVVEMVATKAQLLPLKNSEFRIN